MTDQEMQDLSARQNQALAAYAELGVSIRNLTLQLDKMTAKQSMILDEVLEMSARLEQESKARQQAPVPEIPGAVEGP